MTLPGKITALLIRFEQAFPLPQGTPGTAHEERCRQWAIRFAQQCEYAFPDEGYGVKRASKTRPISKDSLANNRLAGHLVSWDLMSGAGTGKPKLSPHPQFHDIPGQTFVPVTGTDHLGGSAPDPIPQPDPPPLPPPTPKPAKPAHPYTVQTPLAREIGKLLDVPGSPYEDNGEGIGEVVGHLLWKVQFEGVSLDAVRENARRRARGEAAD